LLYGALFGFFCYATFELTSLSLLKHWTWPVVAVDIAWGTFVTATASTLGLLIANWMVLEGVTPDLSAVIASRAMQSRRPKAKTGLLRRESSSQ
jgi:hypothetical protein